MKVRWTGEALRNIRAIRSSIAQDDPRAADRTAARIRGCRANLSRFPMIGHAVEPAGTRELVIAGTPYVMLYRATAEVVEILRVMHGAQVRDQEAGS